MKCVKFVITALLALFCFVMSSELYQLHLQMFSNQYFYIDIENEDRSQVCSIVASAAKKYAKTIGNAVYHYFLMILMPSLCYAKIKYTSILVSYMFHTQMVDYHCTEEYVQSPIMEVIL